ncbi:MAG: hypothetical protein IPM64_04670 [Phycisphaerales bacterium]|nr:hypothetical protein [Phycisphaerales bacterium]
MTRITLLIALALSAGTTVVAQVQRDVYLDAGIPMIRSDREVLEPWYAVVLGADDSSAFVSWAELPSWGQVYVSRYWPDLDAEFLNVAIPYAFQDRGYSNIAVFDGGCVICWCRISGELACAVVDTGGAIAADPLDLEIAARKERFPAMSADSAGVSITFSGGVGNPCSTCNVFLQQLPIDLDVVPSTLTIATRSSSTEQVADVCVFRASDERTGVLFVRRHTSTSRSAYLRWVAADGSMEPAIQLPLVFHGVRTGRLLDSNELLLIWSDPAGSFYSGMYSMSGVPLSAPRILHEGGSVYGFAISPDGWILAADEDFQGAIRFRLFRPDGSPTGDWFDPTTPDPDRPLRTMDLSVSPIAVTRGGTIWIAWLARPTQPLDSRWHLTSLVPFTRGDLNGDGVFNNFDIDPFVLALTDRPAYEALYPGIAADLVADYDGDGTLNNFDIDPFVAAIVAGP